MSTVADILSSAQDGKLTENMARSFGLTTEQAAAAIDALTPALAAGLQNAATDPQALQKLLAGVMHPTHQAAYDDPAVAHGEEAHALGQSAVAHLFGSAPAAGEVAQVAGRDLGISSGILARMLPVLASVLLGGLSKSFANQGLGSILGQLVGAAFSPQAKGGLGGLLGSILGAALGGGATQAPRGGPTPLPGGLDLASLEAAIRRIQNALGRGAPAPASQNQELQDVLDKIFPK